MLGIPARRIWFGKQREGTTFPFRQPIKKGESPAAKWSRRGVIARSVAGFPEGDVGGAVFGRRFQLDEAAAQPGGAECRSTYLEVHVGLAARLGDLAPAGADLVALPREDPVIGGLGGFPLDRDDGERRADVEGPEGAGMDAVVEPGEGAECDSHNVSPWVVSRGPPPAMSRARRPHRAPVSPRASCERPKQRGGPGRRENLQRSGREEWGTPSGDRF